MTKDWGGKAAAGVLEPGDDVVVEVEGVGMIRNSVVAEAL
jgi:2-keto-4-pentenoate hydratase/2-oxohepta-3-ene-1,7-dioic acid hydratase in catechol pathway